MIINAPGFVPVLRQPGHARRDGAGVEKEEEKKKQEVKWGRKHQRKQPLGNVLHQRVFSGQTVELCFWKTGCGTDEEEGPVGGYP